jgi:hypothetical protein
MIEQRFSVILKCKDPISDEVVEQLYGQCDDATAGSCDRVGHVHFDRPVALLNEAIVSAIADLRACGLEVERIEIDPEDLVDAANATA